MPKRYQKTQESISIPRRDLHGMLSHHFKVKGYTLRFETGIGSVYSVFLEKKISKLTTDIIELDESEFIKIVNPNNWSWAYDWDCTEIVTDRVKGLWLIKTEIE